MVRAAVTNERGRWVTHREEMKKTLKVAKKKHGADYKQQLTPTIAKDLDSLQLRLTNEPLDVTIGPAAGGEITASMRGRSGGAQVADRKTYTSTLRVVKIDAGLHQGGIYYKLKCSCGGPQVRCTRASLVTAHRALINNGRVVMVGRRGGGSAAAVAASAVLLLFAAAAAAAAYDGVCFLRGSD